MEQKEYGIIQNLLAGINHNSIAKDFKVSKSTIQEVIKSYFEFNSMELGYVLNVFSCSCGCTKAFEIITENNIYEQSFNVKEYPEDEDSIDFRIEVEELNRNIIIKFFKEKSEGDDLKVIVSSEKIGQEIAKKFDKNVY